MNTLYTCKLVNIKGGNLEFIAIWEPSVGDRDDTEPLNGLGVADQTLPCLTDW